MSFEEIQSGCVLLYPYRWKREAERGETEGRKPRPTAVGFRIRRADGADVLILFPITTQPPSSGRAAVEIPDSEKRRAGLSTDKRLWIIIDEGNEDIVGRSAHIAPQSVIGRFGKAFFLPLVREVIRRRASSRLSPRSG